jgi:hypothetical protein
MVRIISESIPGMEDTQVVDILNIALLEVEVQRILLREEMKSVEGFSLCFCNRGNVTGARKTLEACKVAACILNYDFPINVEQKRTGGVRRISAKPCYAPL